MKNAAKIWSKETGTDRNPAVEVETGNQVQTGLCYLRLIVSGDGHGLPANPRTRLIYDEPKFRGYEVVLDVWSDVFAYGILLVPKNLQPGGN